MRTRRQRWLRGTVLGVLLLLTLVSTLPLVVSVEGYRGDVELQLAAAINHDVSIDSLSLRTVPTLRLVASGVRIGRPGQGESSELQVGSIDIYPDIVPLLDGQLDINNIRLKDVVLRRSFIEAMVALGNKKAGDKEALAAEDDFAVTIRNVQAESVSIVLDEVTTIGPYRVDIALNDKLIPTVIKLARMDGKAKVTMLAVKQGYQLNLQASNWRLPVGPALDFDALHADGLLDSTGVRITGIKSRAYKGELSGKTDIDWSKGWRIEGALQGKNINSEPLLAVFLQQPVISGRFTGGFNYKLVAKHASQLGARPRINGNFMFANGVIYNADLEKATNLLNSDAVKGGTTPFSEVSGYLKIKNKAVQVSKLKVKSKVLEAAGKVSVDADNKLAGVIEVGVSKTGSLVSVPIKISGTVDAPSLRPTNEAIAGGAVGTGLLGPGVGTAVGIKIGSFFGNLFGSDDDEPAKKPVKKPQPAKEQAGSSQEDSGD